MQTQLAEIVREFEAASARLRALAGRLDPVDWRRRPAPERWSPGECVAHLNLTSVAFLPVLRAAIDEAKGDRRPAAARYRRGILGWLLWRTMGPPVRTRVRTPAGFVPAADRSGQELVDEFEHLQADQLALVRAADGLPIDRVRIASPFSARLRYNLFAALSILPRHQHRHLWQAERARITL